MAYLDTANLLVPFIVVSCSCEPKIVPIHCVHDSASLIPTCVYLLSVAVDEQVKGNSSNHVDEEPTFEVVNGDTDRVTHHFIISVHICCPKRKSADQT